MQSSKQTKLTAYAIRQAAFWTPNHISLISFTKFLGWGVHPGLRAINKCTKDSWHFISVVVRMTREMMRWQAFFWPHLKMHGQLCLQERFAEAGRVRRWIAISLLKQINYFLSIVLNKSSYIAFNIQYILHIFTNRCAYSWLVLIFFFL